MDHFDRSITSPYIDLLQMSEAQDMSVWGSQTQLYKPPSQPVSISSELPAIINLQGITHTRD